MTDNLYLVLNVYNTGELSIWVGRWLEALEPPQCGLMGTFISPNGNVVCLREENVRRITKLEKVLL